MKKMKRVFMFLIITIFLSCFAGCNVFYNPNTLYRETLSDELKAEIKKDILWQFDHLIYWDGITGQSNDPYYGTINDCIIVRALHTNEASDGVTSGHIEIAGYDFKTPKPIGLYAYRDGEVCELKDAYENGWLTKEQIEKIYKKHNEIYAGS